MQRDIEILKQDLQTLEQDYRIFREEIHQQIWKLNNPFKFAVGDLVCAYCVGNPKTVYKIVDRRYVMCEWCSHNKLYELFDCVQNVKTDVYESDIQLYQEEQE